jgi:hypothetical protein
VAARILERWTDEQMPARRPVPPRLKKPAEPAAEDDRQPPLV